MTTATEQSVAQQTAQRLREHQQQIAETIIDRQYELQPHWQKYGERGRHESIKDAVYHLTYLAESIEAEDPTVFAEYLVWVKGLFAGFDFPPDTMSVALKLMLEAAQDVLTPPQAEWVAKTIAAGWARFKEAPQTPSGHLLQDNPLSELAQTYLDTLLAGNRQKAMQQILQAVENGASVKAIYRHVFQPVQREIGRLWQLNRVTVAQEHFCTAATQLIMSQLYPHIFSEQRIGRRLVATAVEGELHEIGIRMVADFFEMEGWDTYYMGANMPDADIVRTISQQEAHVLAISATIPMHISRVRNLIAAVRADEATRHTPILVGGYPFNQSPQLWRNVGADGYAPDADQALQVAAYLAEGQP